jgi:Protein of unknown function (DUF3305)
MGLSILVAMRYEPIANPWISHRWVLDQVQVDTGQLQNSPALRNFSLEHIRGIQTFAKDEEQRWWFSGFHLDLFVDECEGYFLNVTSDKPCWFVMWRMEDDPLQDGQSIAVPHRVMLSYNEAARLLDGGEQVDQYPLEEVLLESVKEYVAQHYRPEVKKRHRPESFKGAHRGVKSGERT